MSIVYIYIHIYIYQGSPRKFTKIPFFTKTTTPSTPIMIGQYLWPVPMISIFEFLIEGVLISMED